MKKLVSLVLALAMVLSMGTMLTVASAEEPIHLTWAMGTGDVAPVDVAVVMEELNRQSSEKIGVTFDMQYFTGDQVTISMQAGEVYDIYFTCSWYNNTNQNIANGMFLPLTVDQIKAAAPGLYDAMSEDVWQLATANDGYIYAIPNKKDYAAECFFVYPADYAAKYGCEIPAVIEKYEELTPFFEAWKADMPDDYPIKVGGGLNGVDADFDFIDRTAMIGCTFGTTEVIWALDDPTIHERVVTIGEWYDKGLINPDSAQLTEEAIDGSKERVLLAQAWDGYDFSVGYGWNASTTRFCGPLLNVDYVQGSMNALSIALEGDDAKINAALKLFELIHTDHLFNDTLRYGVKGTHWDYVTEEQSAACAGGVLKTQYGRDNYNPWGFSQPAYFFNTIEVSEAQVAGTAKAPVLDQYEQYYAAVASSAQVSALGAFRWDSSNFTTQLAEISAVKDEYQKALYSGSMKIADVYDEYLAKLNAAGLQDIIADCQAQLDAYLAQNA